MSWCLTVQPVPAELVTGYVAGDPTVVAEVDKAWQGVLVVDPVLLHVAVTGEDMSGESQLPQLADSVVFGGAPISQSQGPVTVLDAAEAGAVLAWMDAHPAAELMNQHLDVIAETFGEDPESEVLDQLGDDYEALRGLYRQAVEVGASVVKSAV